MSKKLLFFLVFTSAFILHSCAELGDVIGSVPGQMNSETIARGLRQALDKGIDKQVTKLTKKDGFYENQLVKILLPAELARVEQTLRDIGLGSLADEGLKLLNHAAEDAVKEATPIFVDAVRGITFADARQILMGADTAATTYLQGKTEQNLYNKFHPVIKSSFSKVGADQVWSRIIERYNAVPFVQKVNPDLTDYVTNEALKGVFTMIAVEEKEIRNNIHARTTPLLKQVFALQDNR
ncbi:MAG TPA: DUF4197 domain-containing protein [Flavobacteriaceae bacterium]|nr:DUF4197 domain-containing protein [Flavobacteriaceae bacterium]